VRAQSGSAFGGQALLSTIGGYAQRLAHEAGALPVLIAVAVALATVLGGLVLAGAIHATGNVDRNSLRWYVGLRDLWFLVWGLLLALAAISYWRRTRVRPVA